MAGKRYSPQDQAKMARDVAADYRAKGVDVRDITPVCPGGLVEAIKGMNRDFSFVRDQSQEQTARNKERHERNVREGKERNRKEAEQILRTKQNER